MAARPESGKPQPFRPGSAGAEVSLEGSPDDVGSRPVLPAALELQQVRQIVRKHHRGALHICITAYHAMAAAPYDRWMDPPAIDLNVEAVRRQFPALRLQIGGCPAVYFDNPAGTQVPQRVIDRTAEYWHGTNANRGGVFTTSRQSDALLDRARAIAAAFLNAEAPEEVIFGPNMTTLTFAFSRALARDLNPGDEIVLTRLEHDANVAPWLALEEQGVRIRLADIRTPECTLDLEDLERHITRRTRVVAMTHASNVVGTIPDVHAASRLAHDAGALLWIDASTTRPTGRSTFGPWTAIFWSAPPTSFMDRT